LLTDRQTNKVWQKHYLLGGGNNLQSSTETSTKKGVYQRQKPM